MKKIVIASMLACAFSAASAVDLYSQAPHTPGASGGNGMSAVFDGGFSGDRQVADDFTVTGAGWAVNELVSSWVQFTDGNSSPINSVNVAFFNKTGGTVGSMVGSASASVSVATGPGTYFSRTERIVTATFADINLAPGDYFVMIQPNVAHNWFWLTATPTTAVQGASAHFRTGNGESGWPSTWTPTGTGDIFNSPAGGHDANFIVRGSAVPEPATMAVLGLGAAALLRRRRKNA